MTLKEAKEYISKLIGHILFDYNEKSCGIDPISRNEIDMWYGDECVTLNSIDSVIRHKLFDGKALSDIWDDITEIDY